ncbi:MAG: HAMP domain-containing sensor histidine kinase [Terracidiphilus sp.]
MPDNYQLPALVLMTLLLPAYGFLYFRFRNTRTLLWFLGFLCAVIQMVLFYKLGAADFIDGSHPWLLAAGETSIQISSALFLASLSPLHFRLGRLNVLYVVPFTIPLVVYSLLFYGVFHGVSPRGLIFLIFPALGVLSLIAGLFWGIARGSMPPLVAETVCVLAGCIGLLVCFANGAAWPLTLVECANHFMTALLLIFVFQRVTPGVVLSVLGFWAWSFSIFTIFPAIALNPLMNLYLLRLIVLGKVVAALGMILVALEDQLALNKVGRERERRARGELEAYANPMLVRRRVEDFDRQGNEICQLVVDHSRFAQAALLLETGGRYRLAGAAGLDAALVSALDSLAGRIPLADFLAPGAAPPAFERSQTVNLSLAPWLSPGDDLKRLRFTSALAVPIVGRSASEGALLLAGMRSPRTQLRADELLPLEILAGRLQAVRSQTRMLEKLIDSEKLAGLGQLAGNVTQQLNNPLTVILGYASLLDEGSTLTQQERKAVEAIINEARRMKATLESLSRISRRQTEQFDTISVSELLADMEQLHRSEFLNRSIDFRLNIAPGLPSVRCNAQQLRQAVLHCLQFAIEAADSPSSGFAPNETPTRTVRLEATAEGKVVQILVAHSGPGFLYPERAFDPFIPAQTTGEMAALGLGLCATIIRDHNGRASAVNLEPTGAAIILELQAA